MSLSVFSPDILPSPFMATDQLITSLAYSGDIVWWDKQFSLFLLPKDSVLYPTSLLGVLYSYIKKNPHIKRIVYIRERENIETLRPSDSGVNFVLGKKILYDLEYYDNLPFPIQGDKDFYVEDEFWASHVMYARLLEDNVKLVPLVLWKNFQKNNFWLDSLFESIFRDSDTICVLCQNVTFSADDQEEILLRNGQEDFLAQSFYSYADKIDSDTTLLQSELINTQSNWNDVYQTFQWIFAL